jgi:hypothetical protein
VAEPRVVDGLEHHHAAPAARRRVPRQRAQLQVVPARPAAAAQAPVSSRSVDQRRKQVAEEEVRPRHAPVGDGGDDQGDRRLLHCQR